jgi:predicted signal transduction protein with EAL and GGDEF domain
MAVRLQMKLGVVAEAERLEDSPDTVAVVEPTIGATSRSKGSLYVVVSGVGRARRLQEATRLVADTVQGEYYTMVGRPGRAVASAWVSRATAAGPSDWASRWCAGASST